MLQRSRIDGVNQKMNFKQVVVQEILAEHPNPNEWILPFTKLSKNLEWW